MVMGESAIWEDVVAKVMVVTSLVGVEEVGTTASHLCRGNGQICDRAHCYAFPGRSEAETSDAVITSNLWVCDCMASVLFDPGSTFSYVSSSFATDLDLLCDLLDMPIRVSTLVGESVIVEKVYRSCPVTFMEAILM